MRNIIYHSGLVSKNVWFLEFKKYLELLNKGSSYPDIKSMQESENIFSARSERNGNRILGAVRARVDALPQDVQDLFFELDVANQKYINLLGVLLTDRLFFEYVYAVYRTQVILGSVEYSPSMARAYIYDMMQQHDELADLIDSTVNRLSSAYTTHLHESGLLDKRGGSYYYRHILMDERLERVMMENNLEPYLKAMKGDA